MNRSAARSGLMLLPALTGLYALAPAAHAEEFALSVSPPRFELSADAGQTVRGVVELSNASAMATPLKFSTAEWDLNPDGGVRTSDALRPNSCRPWVAIERKETTLQAKSQLRYRFEVTPPAGTAPVECRFAIIVAGRDENIKSNGLEFPVSAQIAVLVYVAVGGVKPQLEIVKADVRTINGQQTPVLEVKNNGQAHGRLSAFLKSVDAKGVKRELAPSTLPILPGETRTISLGVDNGTDAVEADKASPPAKPDPITFPLKVSGTMNDSVSAFAFEGTFEP